LGSEHIYKLRYTLGMESGEFTPKDITDGQGLCDMLLLFSINEDDSGNRSTMTMSQGGDGKELNDMELFKAWSLMAHNLAKSTTIGAGRKDLAKQVFEIVRENITGKKRS
jgi:hypothetical protein